MKNLKPFLLIILLVNVFAIHAQNQNSDYPTENPITTSTPKLNSDLKDKTRNPLLVINGFLWGYDTTVLNIINPNSIDNVKVVKDKAATELFGEKGKNGVLIVNLKDKNINSLEKFKTAYNLHESNTKEQNVSGIIYDTKKNTIPNVSITNLNRKESFKSDSNGNYSLIARENDIVVFYQNGFKTSTLKVKGTKINVVMSSDNKTEKQEP